MEALTGDLIVEILSRLPVKSIVRARCVSKSWNRLISEDCRQRKRLPPAMAGIIFKHRYINHHAVWFVKTRDTSCYDGKSPTADPDFGAVPFYMPPNIVSVCNGLALCICFLETVQFAVCNPATGRWKSLRRPDCKDFHLLAIGFDPRLSRHYRVLGYYQDQNSTYKFKMFLSETDKWVDCARNYQPDPTMEEYISMKCVSHNGIFHIIHVLYRVVEREVCKRIEIFAVDIEENNCGRIELPYHAPLTWSQILLGVSDGLLHLAMRSGDEMLVWAMEDYNNNQWVLKHARSFAGIEEKLRNFAFFNGYTLSHFHPDMNAIFIQLEQAIVSYNFATGNLGVFYLTHGSNYHPFSPCFSSNDV